VGAIFETPAFYEFLSGWTNLKILSEYTARTEDCRIQEVIERVGLTGHEHRKVKTYSHGMRARLALAQALLPDPQLLILDEPADGLDPEGIREIRHTIQRLNRELGLTILFSSHLLAEVEQLCTRIAVLNQGRLVFNGALGEAIHARRRVRLVVNDFERAAGGLKDRGLIDDFDVEGLIHPASSVENGLIVSELVRLGFEVREIYTEEDTLEDFYLKLMKQT
jgi:ABC-2 type transport system ATP-binding protein